jgi:hypothetical protein
MRSRRDRIPDRVNAPSVVAVLVWCAFATYLVVQALLGPVLIWTDSKVYAAMAHAGLGSRHLWAGARPPLTPLVLKVAGSPTAFVVVQAVVAALAWGVLAWTVGQLVKAGWRRTGAGLLILGFATTLPVAQWNRSELSESLSLSLLALVVASFIWTSRNPTWPRIAATAAVCLAFAATRDAQVWTVGFLAIAAIVYALTRVSSDRSGALRATVLATTLLSVVILAEWGTLTSQRTTSDTADVFFVRVFPYPERVAWFAAHGMPEQHLIDQVAREVPTSSSSAKVVGVPLDNPAFAPLHRWVEAHGGRTYLHFLVTHPWYVASEPFLRPERTFNSADGNLSFYAPTTHPARSPLTPILWPPAVVVLVVAALALGLGVATGATRSDPWRMVVVLTVIGMAAMLVAWHGDGQEVTRHTIEGFAEVRLGVWILVILGLSGLPFPRRREDTADREPVDGSADDTKAAVRSDGGPPPVVDSPRGQ